MTAGESPGAQRQYHIRYWFLVYGYDQVYVDVFLGLGGAPSEEAASHLVDAALRKLDLVGLNKDHTSPREYSVVYREDRGQSWDLELGHQEPRIDPSPGEVLLRTYRVREAFSEYPHLSKARELRASKEDLE